MTPTSLRVLASLGALLAGASIGISAWASHGLAPGREQHNVLMACMFAFGHGTAWLALAPQAATSCLREGLWLQVVGVLLFCGSLIANAVAGWPTRLAPIGGMALMGGWLLLALAVWLRPVKR